MIEAHYTGPFPDVVRKSTMLRKFRAAGGEGMQRAIDEIEKVHAMFPSCPEHGKLEDPIICIVGAGETSQIDIACPWCSGPEIRDIWEKEANLS